MALWGGPKRMRRLAVQWLRCRADDSGNDDVGVIREYHVAEQDGTAIATIEVRSCHEEGHV